MSVLAPQYKIKSTEDNLDLESQQFEMFLLKNEFPNSYTIVQDIKTILKKYEWIEKYRQYAHLNNLYDIEEIDDDNIFRVCNIHHMNKLLSTFKVECTCDTEYDMTKHAEKEHYIDHYDICCSYGTNVMIFPKKKKVIKFIGFIECDNITKFCSVNFY